jgi:hypothetical protein
MKRLVIVTLILFYQFTASAQFGYTSFEGTFGQPTQHISELTDVLFNATKRFTVTPDLPQLFDGAINNVNWTINAGSSATLNIDFTTKGEVGVNGITYPQGYVYISFYSSGFAQSVSGQVKDKDGVWRNITAWTDVSVNSAYKVFRGTIGEQNYVTAISITVTAPSADPCLVSKIEYHRFRPDGDILPAYVSRYMENKFWKAIHFLNDNNQVTSSLKTDGGAFFNGNVGLGTSTPQAKLDVNGNIFTSGKLAIGTTDPAKIGAYALAVNGEAIFNKAKVKLYGTWPDYVFNKNYKLRSLGELERYIQDNAHLPGVPSAAEVEKNGIDLGDTQAALLKKIEELTLYVIEQNKKLEKQAQKLKQQQEQINKLSHQSKKH